MTHELDLERALLGASIVDSEAIAKIVPILKPPDLKNLKHQKILAAQIELFERGVVIDTLTLVDELRKRGDLEFVGGEVYLVEISSNASAGNVEQYARVLKERSIKRQTADLGLRLQKDGNDPEADAFETLRHAEDKILGLSGVLSVSKPEIFGKALAAQLKVLDGVRDGKKELGQKTGFYDLDNILGAFQEPDLIILAARPSQGKTSLSLSIARNISEGVPIAYFSLEMSKAQVVTRMISMESGLSFRTIQNAKWQGFQEAKIFPAIKRLDGLKLNITDQSAMTLLDIRAQTKRLVMEYGIKGIVVDYLGLMNHGDNDSLNNAIGDTTKGLKGLNKDMGVWCLLLSQLNRGNVTDGIKPPQLWNLRDSGNIEADADAVIFIHRPEQFMGNNTVDGKGKDWKGIAEIIVAKQRNGALGNFELRFNSEAARFESAARFNRSEPVKVIEDPAELLYNVNKPQDEMPF